MTVTETSDNFNFFAPVEITKGEIDGQKVMKMGGVASTSSKDADGEFLNPAGFDLEYFMNKGFMNWNHQTSKDPLSYIGRPTKGEVTNRGLEIECELFANNPKAQQVYQLAEVLSSNGMQLGFSIEGKVVKRNEKNPKIVEKAVITGCAITPNPKNEDAVANIIKGIGSDVIGEDTFTMKGDFDLLKGMSAYEDKSDEEAEKAMMAGGNMEPLVKESVDGDVKHTEKSMKKPMKKDMGSYTKKADDCCEECGEKCNDYLEKRAGCSKKSLSKGEVYNRIYTDFPEIEDNVANELYNLIEILTSKMEKSNITSEEISKAYEALGLSDTVEETTEEVVEETVEESTDEVVKGEESTELSWDDLTITDEEVEAAKEILSKANIGFTLTSDEVEEESIEEDLEKGLVDDNTDDLVELVKGQFDELSAKAEEANLATATLIKGLEDQLNELKSENEALRADVNAIGGQSQGRKSVISKAVERSFGAEEENDLTKGDDLKAISVSGNKKAILDTLEKGYFDTNSNSITNNSLANDSLIFESSNQLSEGIVEYMKGQGFKLVK